MARFTRGGRYKPERLTQQQVNDDIAGMEEAQKTAPAPKVRMTTEEADRVNQAYRDAKAARQAEEQERQERRMHRLELRHHRDPEYFGDTEGINWDKSMDEFERVTKDELRKTFRKPGQKPPDVEMGPFRETTAYYNDDDAYAETDNEDTRLADQIHGDMMAEGRFWASEE